MLKTEGPNHKKDAQDLGYEILMRQGLQHEI
jgi:hypothetical protein